MKAEVETGARAPAPPRGSKRETCDTPTRERKQRISGKKTDAVLSGRVSKSKSLTPTKKRGVNVNAVKGVKEETVSSASSMMGMGEEGNEGLDDAAGGQWEFDEKDVYDGLALWQSGQGFGNGMDAGVYEA